MYSKHINSFHFVKNKLNKDWCYEVMQSLYYNTNRKNLLHGKNIREIDQYATGEINMAPFKRMYKSIELQSQKDRNADPDYEERQINSKHMQFEPLPLIPAKLNSAVATMQKVPFEITVKALDALAVKKKKEDVNFLVNKPKVENELQDLADKMGIGKVDLGTTKHSAIKYSDAPYGLDLNDPDELQIFVDLLYSLSVESSFETALQIFYELKNLLQLRLQETHSHLRYGVSVNRAFESDITGLPDASYVDPWTVEVPPCRLPDMSDRTHDFEYMNPTVMELFNMFGSEIKDEADLENIINGPYGYCNQNKLNTISSKDFITYKTDLIYCNVKTIDWVGVRSVVDSDGEISKELTDDEELATEKIWGQNTYTFYWLKNTKYFFKIDKLGYAHRTKGQEQNQGFDKNIYRSQQKSAVEQSIGENKKAQIASIKLIHALIKSLPAGKVIDLKGMRSALSGALKDEAGYSMDRLIMMALEENNIIIDTEGFDGKNDGQLKPFYEIPGGVKTELIGYIQTIADANSKIAQFTGINEQLTGTSANPEGLIGLQKLLINSSINSLHYIQEAITSQYQKLMNIWAHVIKAAVEAGGARKEGIINCIGEDKADIIDGLDDLPLHNMGTKITLTQREEERARFEAKKQKLVETGVLSIADEYMLDAIQNPKDKVALMAVKEKQFLKRKSKAELEKFQQQQQLIQQNGQNQMNVIGAKGESEKQAIYAKGEVQGKILSLANELGLTQVQMQGLVSRALQKDRGIDQERKAISTIKAKQEADSVKPLV